MYRIFILSLFILLSFFTAIGQKNKKTSKSIKEEPKTAFLDINVALKPVKWRSIGPFQGGRSVATSGVVGDPLTYYMGTTGGGVWKTEDMGNTWNNISDGYFDTGSVGAIAVSESEPNTVYVGMGEHAVRGVMTHHGDGVYKSYDAGKTWKKSGLEMTQHIARIVIHPRNPNIVYIAAQGALYGPSKDRGIYKSIDGGTTWDKVLYVDENTGCSELSMDMNNPMVLYAAMWEHGRKPWKVISGGPGSGLYKSVDGGETWDKIHQGLPDELGKMSITVCRSNSERVYALIESDSEKEIGGLFVSNDAGDSWSHVTNNHRLIQRAWYYIELFVDPQNDNVLYVLSAPALKSIDGGNTWEDIYAHHGDYHDLWINPNNPKNMALADDGGVSISVNSGKTWTDHEIMPIGQFYRINVDNQFPYRIYGGQQDFPSLSIASRELGSSGITRKSWEYSAGGESAFLAFDPDNPRYVMGGSYLGTIEVLDTKAKAGTNIMAAPIQYLGRESKDMKYRFNWNAPIVWSKYEPNTFYHGAQNLLKTTDLGVSWKEVSPDLTRNEKEKQGKGGGPYTNEAVGAENYGTLSYVIESPHEKGVILTGSDDGYVQITRDNCQTWTNITPTGLKDCLINAIEVSPHSASTIYIATTRYKFNDHKPGVYKSTDYGKTWTNISNNIPDGSFTRVIREDDVKKDLLYAGTEKGVYVSYNGGQSWSSMQLNLPNTPITDLKVHQGNLIASTSGRSFWVLDDLSLVRQFNADTTLTILYKTSPFVLVNGSSELDRTSPEFKGTNDSRGVNPSTGAVIYYHLPKGIDSTDIYMEIRDQSGFLVRRLSSKVDSTYLKYEGGPPEEPLLSKSKGLNRFVWNLRHSTMPGIPNVYIESSFRGHKASPGKYEVKLFVDSLVLTSEIEILPNPLYEVNKQTYATYSSLMKTMEADVTTMHLTVNDLYKKSLQLTKLLSTLPSSSKTAELRKEGEALSAKLKVWDEEMVQRKSKAYDDVENYENKFTANYMFMLNHNESDLPRVNQPTMDRKVELDKEWSTLKSTAEKLMNSDIPAFNQKLWEAGFGAIWDR